MRVHTINLSEGTKLLDSQYLRPLLRLEHAVHGLHYANDVPDHPHLLHVETHVLPALDLTVSFFTEREGGSYPSRFYCDMASINPGPDLWTIRDLYLDVSLCPGQSPELLDMDEYAEAVLEGHLMPDEQRRALLSAERVVNGLFAHGNDLEGWLASLGLHLDWWTPVRA